MMAQRKHGKHHIHGTPAVQLPRRVAARRDRVPRVVVAARDLQPGVQRLQQLQLAHDVAAWRRCAAWRWTLSLLCPMTARTGNGVRRCCMMWRGWNAQPGA